MKRALDDDALLTFLAELEPALPSISVRPPRPRTGPMCWSLSPDSGRSRPSDATAHNPSESPIPFTSSFNPAAPTFRMSNTSSS